MDFMLRPGTLLEWSPSWCLRYGRISWSFHLHWRASGGLYGSVWIPLQQWDAMAQPLNHHLNHQLLDSQWPMRSMSHWTKQWTPQAMLDVWKTWPFYASQACQAMCNFKKNFTMHHPTILTLPYGQMPEPCHVVETDGGSHLEGLRRRVAISVLRI